MKLFSSLRLLCMIVCVAAITDSILGQNVKTGALLSPKRILAKVHGRVSKFVNKLRGKNLNDQKETNEFEAISQPNQSLNPNFNKPAAFDFTGPDVPELDSETNEFEAISQPNKSLNPNFNEPAALDFTGPDVPELDSNFNEPAALDFTGPDVTELDSLASANRLSLRQFIVRPNILKNFDSTVSSLKRLKLRVDQGSLTPADVKEDTHPLAIDLLRGQSLVNLGAGAASAQCEPPLNRPCENTPYRTMSGRCSHPARPTWGQAETPLIRILPNNYADGVFAPRTRSKMGDLLPSARQVSLHCVSVGESFTSDRFTLAVMQLGQFLDHDLVHVPVFNTGDKTTLDCCLKANRNNDKCLPIKVPVGDPIYKQARTRCLNFLRSIPAEQGRCKNRAAEQVNQISHFIDGSNMYGSSEEDLRSLRLGGHYLMKTSKGADLPTNTRGSSGCTVSGRSRAYHCFEAGDTRVNVQPGLTLMHGTWVQYHNAIARVLKRTNPSVNNEHIFQETRAIVIATMQKIYYSDWLPIIIGSDLMRRTRLLDRADANDNFHPGIVTEFSTAAFRFGHSLVAGWIKKYQQNGRATSARFQLSDWFFQPGNLVRGRQHKVDLLTGMCHQPMKKMDNTFTDQLVGKLFRGNNKVGLDLVALNIQRGRDHAIASYSQTISHLKNVCPHLRSVSKWRHLDRYMSSDKVKLLRRIYKSVEDVDLFIGGVFENGDGDALVGPTFACIIADQFLRLKHGDKHFYNHRTTMFSQDQLRSIETMTLAHVMCSSPGMEKVPVDVFRIVSGSNRRIRCRHLPALSLSPWQGVLPRR